MSFNDWDDNEDDFDREENHNGYFDRIRQNEKEMLKIDMNRNLQMPPSLEEWKQFFGETTDLDGADITQGYIKQYHHYGEEYIPTLVDAFDINWIRYLLGYNELVEEYELCAILKSHIDIHHTENIEHHGHI